MRRKHVGNEIKKRLHIAPLLLMVLLTILVTTYCYSQDEATPPTSPGQVKVDSLTKEEKYYVGEDIHYIIRLSWKGKEDTVEIRRPKTPVLEGLERIYTDQTISQDSKTGTSVLEYIFVLQPLTKDKASIGPITINYTLKENGQQGTAKLAGRKFKFEERPKKEFPIGKIFRFLVGILLVTAISGVIWLLAIGRIRVPLFRRQWFIADEDEEPSPYERLMAEASTLKMHLMNEDTKKFYDKLFLLVRRIASQRTGKDIDTATDDEFIQAIMEINDDEFFTSNTIELMDTCQQVRLSGNEPSTHESEVALGKLRNLLKSEDQRFKKQRKLNQER
jgi:hypothetical protein